MVWFNSEPELRFTPSHSARLGREQAGLKEWITKVPLDAKDLMKRDNISVRTTTGLHWAMSVGGYAVWSKSAALLYPTPFQDFVDRPEYLVGGSALGGLSIGAFIGLKKGFYFTSHAPPGSSIGKLVLASLIKDSAKHLFSFSILSLAFLSGDRLVMDIKREIALKQNSLTPDNDVTRTPLNYAVGGAIAGGCFPWMDAYRKTNLIRNFAVWSTYGCVLFTILGFLITEVQSRVACDMTDEKAFNAYRNSLIQSCAYIT